MYPLQTEASVYSAAAYKATYTQYNRWILQGHGPKFVSVRGMSGTVRDKTVQMFLEFGQLLQ